MEWVTRARNHFMSPFIANGVATVGGIPHTREGGVEQHTEASSAPATSSPKKRALDDDAAARAELSPSKRLGMALFSPEPARSCGQPSPRVPAYEQDTDDESEGLYDPPTPLQVQEPEPAPPVEEGEGGEEGEGEGEDDQDDEEEEWEDEDEDEEVQEKVDEVATVRLPAATPSVRPPSRTSAAASPRYTPEGLPPATALHPTVETVPSTPHTTATTADENNPRPSTSLPLPISTAQTSPTTDVPLPPTNTIKPPDAINDTAAAAAAAASGTWQTPSTTNQAPLLPTPHAPASNASDDDDDDERVHLMNHLLSPPRAPALDLDLSARRARHTVLVLELRGSRDFLTLKNCVSVRDLFRLVAAEVVALPGDGDEEQVTALVFRMDRVVAAGSSGAGAAVADGGAKRTRIRAGREGAEAGFRCVMREVARFWEGAGLEVGEDLEIPVEVEVGVRDGGGGGAVRDLWGSMVDSVKREEDTEK